MGNANDIRDPRRALFAYIDKHARLAARPSDLLPTVTFQPGQHVVILNDPELGNLKHLIRENRRGVSREMNPLDGHWYSVKELEAWLGDERRALCLSALLIHMHAVEPVSLGAGKDEICSKKPKDRSLVLHAVRPQVDVDEDSGNPRYVM